MCIRECVNATQAGSLSLDMCTHRHAWHVYVCACVYMYAYTTTYAHNYMHTRTHTYIHVYVYSYKQDMVVWQEADILTAMQQDAVRADQSLADVRAQIREEAALLAR